MHTPEVPETWDAIRPELLSGPPNALVIGATDVGKSTFCRWLAGQFAAAGCRAWLIDADVGQSQLGPPATVGCARPEHLDHGGEMAFFVGDVSPGRAVPQCLGAFSAALRSVQGAGADRVVVDTTGWISGQDAIALKLAKARAIGQAHIVLIEAADELRAFRRAWRGLPDFPLHQLRPAAVVTRRSQGDRRAFRESALRSAFESAIECELDLREVAISGPQELQDELPVLPSGLLLGLNDAAGHLLSLGALVSLDSGAGRLVCLCQPAGVTATEVRIGQLFVQPDGTHAPVLG